MSKNMFMNCFYILGRTINLVKDTALLPEIKSMQDEKKKIIKFGSHFRYLQSLIASGYCVAVLLFLLGLFTNLNGVLQHSYPAMNLEAFKSMENVKGYVDLDALVIGKFGTEEYPAFGTFDDMNLQLYLIVDRSYEISKKAYAALGLTTGHLKKLSRENPNFDDLKRINKVNFRGLTTQKLPGIYINYFKDRGVTLTGEIPLIIAYQSKSTDVQGLIIMSVLSGFLFISMLLIQLFSNKKQIPQLAAYEDFIKNNSDVQLN